MIQFWGSSKNPRWEKHQTEEEAALGRRKCQRKAVSYREAYAPQLGETLNELDMLDTYDRILIEVSNA
ncbi:hypothetical protein RHMOL_Rhmol08G0212300 [Rhododendron molle]|uniref:Uncharacterized protein n=1 Tax=Rhododendron molle TaxID=49168 RepID=A0ACC0MR55_RHOML|nr:hypothetical protein RHMOL_Rhmol08G0212300 [Rhododendron molle]